MQYVGRAFDSVSKTWSSINPSTLSGAIDIIVVENSVGELSCSPFHVRFGKFQLLRPSQKKVDFIINGKLTNLPMKLGDGGEAFFVFEASKEVDVPSDLITSPVLSAASSPSASPPGSPRKTTLGSLQEPEFLDISQSTPDLPSTRPVEIHPTVSEPALVFPQTSISLATSPKEATLEKLHKISKKLTKINIPTKIDHNGLFLDMNGYKSNAKNIHDTTDILEKLVSEEFGSDIDLSQFVKKDEEGNIIILSNDKDDILSPSILSTDSLEISPASPASPASPQSDDGSSIIDESTSALQSSTNYVKTLRLTSDQLKFLGLKYGENDLCFSVDKGKAVITSKLFLWKQNVPIVISDIDGTITKSDALGHVLTMIGRDWTHAGVAKLFTDIELNGYNIMYLTARSVGLADSTRSYLRNIEQDGIRLPTGPVILTPDRTMAALRREVILKKPEVFKMACLNDVKNLYSERQHPFYAGFGNRITDALSYRSVLIPSSRIFTINPIGEVHMELLELAGYKSTYVNINELVDHFFPPVNYSDIDLGLNDETFTDVNYWREPLPDLSDLSDDEVTKDNANPMNEYQKSTDSPRVNIDDFDKNYNEDEDEDYYDDENDIDEDNDEEQDGVDDYTDGSENGSYEEEDLDAELLQDDYDEEQEEDFEQGEENTEDAYDEEDEISLNDSRSGFLPNVHRSFSDNVSINDSPVIGIPSPNDYSKASDLMNKLSLSDLSTPSKKR